MASIVSQTESASSFGQNMPFGKLTGVQVLGVGSFAPDVVVRNEDLAEHGYDAEWIIQRTGIRERRRAPAEMSTSDMAFEASLKCLEQANLDASQIDLILVATCTPDTLMPSTACHLQRRLGCSAPAMDLNAACSGFMYAMVTGMQFIKTGTYKHVLVVGADLMSRVVNPKDEKTFPLFGDGAGAVILGSSEGDQGFHSFTLCADGEGTDLLCMPAGGTREPVTIEAIEAGRQYMHMDGRSVFKWAVRTIADTILDLLREASLAPADIDLFVLHQANIRIIDAAADSLDVDRDRVFVNLDRYGNTSAASIPLVLDEAHEQGRIQRGDNILVCGFGAGLTWGAGVLKW